MAGVEQFYQVKRMIEGIGAVIEKNGAHLAAMRWLQAA